MKITYLFLFVYSNIYFLSGQTTDLSITIEAQNLSGGTISQTNIYEDFQYLITVSNSGDAVNDASISIDFDDDLAIISSSSQNTTNGASDISNIDINNNVLTASIASMPNNSGVELLVLVTAPTNLGGIAANGTISPPNGTTDTNTSNNQSIISIDVLDIVIDFLVTHTQVQPTQGTGISSWGDEVTYQFTVTNNSAIDFPITRIKGILNLVSPNENGQPFAQSISLECLSTTNGASCPDLTGFTGSATAVTSTQDVFIFDENIEIVSGGSITFEIVYQYSNFSCSTDPMPISVDSVIEIGLDHDNISSNTSNAVNTTLLNADLCPETDICIETVQTNPGTSAALQYEQDITFITTVCNDSSLDTPMRFFFQNLSTLVWEIVSVNCIETTGPIACDDFTISENTTLWTTSDFTLPGNTTITIETTVKYFEPDCSLTPSPVPAVIRSATNILNSQIVDSNLDNNSFANNLSFPAVEPCETMDISDLQVVKTQVGPELPIGSSINNTAEWGLVNYEITVTNIGDEDAIIEVQDYMPVPSGDVTIFASLEAVECIATTGSANCFDIQNTNIGVVLDGVTEDGEFDTFWQILPEDNWELPANSSVTFSVTINWQPECTEAPIIGHNVVRTSYVNTIIEQNIGNNTDFVETYFAPCIDLIVQTYPEFTQVDTNENFNWIIDISNSTTSSSAMDVLFENTVNSVFTISGIPTCTITSGNATCITNFDMNDNFVSGIIPSMEAGSTVTINIPVTAPSFGGAFNNTAEAIPNAATNEELTPETNISINSVQVTSPILEKAFSPDTIFEGSTSELSFTVYNISTNPTQSNISFTDNLPTGLTLVSSPNWIEANGCTATFVGNSGDNFVGVSDLTFPDGVETCTFSVMVTSNVSGAYINDFENFTNINNIDASQTSATLNVIVDNSNVDIEVTKAVEPNEVTLGDEVVFTITASSIGTDTATEIEIIDQLPQSYEYISYSVDLGSFNDTTFTWTIPSLFPNEFAELSITVRVISSNNLLNVAFLNNLGEIDRNESNDEDDASVEILNCLNVPEGISPNNDGKNDVLVIPCIEDYPNSSIKIYNRYGTQVYESNGYLNDWSGKANMGILNSLTVLPVGTYFYVLEINNSVKPLVGYIYLNY